MSKKLTSIGNIRKKLNRNSKIVLCHGVFDFLHTGHIDHFNDAKKNL